MIELLCDHINLLHFLPVMISWLLLLIHHISYLLLYNRLSQKLSYYLNIFVGEELGSGLAGCSWCRVSRIVVKIPAEAGVIWHLDWGRRIYCHVGFVKRPHFLTGCWQNASVLHHMDLSTELLNIIAVLELTSSWASDPG